MIGLFVLDVGDTLGTYDRPGVAELLAPLSPFPEHEIMEEVRRVLHRAPELTDEVIEQMCSCLLIDRDAWPDTFPVGGFTAFTYIANCLRALRRIAPIVTLSNLAVIGGPERMADLTEQCGDVISECFTSYALAERKPAPWLWMYLADRYHVRVRDVVHVGDRWRHDALGPVVAGARAICLAKTRDSESEIPPYERWPARTDRIQVVDDLRGVEDVALGWAGLRENTCTT